MSTASSQPQVIDAREREQALDPLHSFLVQAPAGSGKTELLALRFLALLAQVDEPEQILALTFTRKATAEMYQRILRALDSAQKPAAAIMSEHETAVRRLAQAALAHAETREWRLMEQPQRLNIQTIDALALSIASRLPVLSRLNGRLTPVDDAGALYALAAERTMAQMGDPSQPELTAALAEILRLRDVNLADCQNLVTRMLAQRDQWLLAVPDIAVSDVPWEALRSKLEEPFRRAHTEAIAKLQTAFAPLSHLVSELLCLARTTCGEAQERLQAIAPLYRLEDLTETAHWLCLCELLLTKENEWRRSITKREGLPADSHRPQAQRLKEVLLELAGIDKLLDALQHARKLPPAAYSPEEASTVRSIFFVLRHALAQLRVIFAEQGTIDFAEAGIGARGALEIPLVRMRLDAQTRHLLVDEFQDTSRPQFGLLQALLDDWQPEEGRTFFLVGDPMQSIYLFRNADPRLFGQVREQGFATGQLALPLTPLQMSTNFRSQPAIVEPLNRIFTQIVQADPEPGVAFAGAVSSRGEALPGEDSVHLHMQVCEPTSSEKEGKRTAEEMNRSEAEAMLKVIHGHDEEMKAAQRSGDKFRIAVLARNRSHLSAIIALLQQERIRFRGVKIHPLKDRQEILDVLSLLRALLHPADRIAWLAVLRAPWCGLPLPALYTLCGEGGRSQTLASLLRDRSALLDEESRRRALHVLAILERAQAAYADGALAASPAGLSLWLEQTWHALGTPLYLDREQRSNCDAFFGALAAMPPHSFGTLDPSFERKLKDLFAQPDPGVSERCGIQLMTIHQAKGLEFEVVLVPQLHRHNPKDNEPLFQWLIEEHGQQEPEELLLAPIGYKHGDKPKLYTWVGSKVRRRLYQETKRLLYVACSRAIRELHLFATLTRKVNGELSNPGKDTLIGAGWAGLEQRILAAVQKASHDANVLPMPAPEQPLYRGVVRTLAAVAAPAPQQLRRLPANRFNEAYVASPAPAAGLAFMEDAGIASRLARIQGVVLHALLERASAGGTAPDWSRAANALLRQHGLAEPARQQAHSAVLLGLKQALAHEHGQWLLLPRNIGAWTESTWSAAEHGRVVRQRPDRVFLAGREPGAPGSDYLWIVDYKTAAQPRESTREAFLQASRERYRDQLERYSRLFRSLIAVDPEAAGRPHRFALYHPMLPWLDWWQP